MPGDDLVGEIIIYYKPPGGEEGSSFSVGGEYGVDFGHVFVEVRDSRTGENHYLDIWEENGQAHINRELDDTRRSEFESVNWRISESQLEGAVQVIEERLSSSTPYGVLDGSCVDSVGEVMRGAGYDVPDRWFPSDFWSEIQDISDANQESATSPADSPEHNISDGEGRYVPPPPNTSESQQDSTPSDANICSPDGHETHIDFPESGQNLTPHDATMSSPDGYESRADSSSIMSSPASYDPSGDDGHSRTPPDANFTDESGHSTHEGSSESSSSSSLASYDPSGDNNPSTSDDSGQYASDPSEAYGDDSCSYEDYSYQD